MAPKGAKRRISDGNGSDAAPPKRSAFLVESSEDEESDGGGRERGAGAASKPAVASASESSEWLDGGGGGGGASSSVRAVPSARAARASGPRGQRSSAQAPVARRSYRLDDEEEEEDVILTSDEEEDDPRKYDATVEWFNTCTAEVSDTKSLSFLFFCLPLVVLSSRLLSYTRVYVFLPFSSALSLSLEQVLLLNLRRRQISKRFVYSSLFLSLPILSESLFFLSFSYCLSSPFPFSVSYALKSPFFLYFLLSLYPLSLSVSRGSRCGGEVTNSHKWKSNLC